MAARCFGAYGLTGGGTGDLDAISDVTFSLLTEDKCIVIRDNELPLFFTYDADSSADDAPISCPATKL